MMQRVASIRHPLLILVFTAFFGHTAPNRPMLFIAGVCPFGPNEPCLALYASHKSVGPFEIVGLKSYFSDTKLPSIVKRVHCSTHCSLFLCSSTEFTTANQPQNTVVYQNHRANNRNY